MVWTIAIANIVAVAVSLLFINHLAKLTTIQGTHIIPWILLLCFIGGYTANNDLADLIVLLVAGGIGYLMVRFGWPRPPFILGFILGDLAETYLYVSTSRYGATWLYRPKVIVLFLIMVMVIVYPLLKRKRGDGKKGESGE